MELLRVANGSGALKKQELRNLIKKYVNKSILPEEIDLIIPAFDNVGSIQCSEAEFVNLMHILHWLISLYLKPQWIFLIKKFAKCFLFFVCLFICYYSTRVYFVTHYCYLSNNCIFKLVFWNLQNIFIRNIPRMIKTELYSAFKISSGLRVMKRWDFHVT